LRDTRAILPDFDVVSFRFGIEYAHELGHRGVSHSLLFAVCLGLLTSVNATKLHAGRAVAFDFVALATASHGLLDMCTNGGLGVAYFWPLTDARYFFPSRPILVSPLSLRRFLEPYGHAVLFSELKWVWLPAASLALALFAMRWKNRH
jgi:inner membrane protein